MSKANNVVLWNQQRRFAKKQYTTKVISALDASGYIHDVLIKPFIRYKARY